MNPRVLRVEQDASLLEASGEGLRHAGHLSLDEPCRDVVSLDELLRLCAVIPDGPRRDAR